MRGFLDSLCLQRSSLGTKSTYRSRGFLDGPCYLRADDGISGQPLPSTVRLAAANGIAELNG